MGRASFKSFYYKAFHWCNWTQDGGKVGEVPVLGCSSEMLVILTTSSVCNGFSWLKKKTGLLKVSRVERVGNQSSYL